jgi:hypothetical protein
MKLCRSAMLLAVAVGVLALAGTLAPAGAASGVTFNGTINGVDLGSANANHPLKISPKGETTVHVDVQNNSGQPITIRNIRVDGKVLGFEFFVFTTRVDLAVPEGGSGDRTFTVDLNDLDRQASGLMNGEISLIDDHNATLTSRTFTLDARGALFSTYTLFGLAVAVLTALLLAATIRRTMNGTLPANRWSRALRYAEPGAGIGLTFVFTLSALRILLVPSALGLTLIVLGIVAGGAIGYLLPANAFEDQDLEGRIGTGALVGEP